MGESTAENGSGGVDLTRTVWRPSYPQSLIKVMTNLRRGELTIVKWVMTY